MSTKHTEGPWQITEHDWRESSIWNLETGQTVCQLSIEDNEETAEEEALVRDANAKRIVACVNSMKGLNPSALAGAVEALEKIAAYEQEGTSAQITARAALAALKEVG